SLARLGYEYLILGRGEKWGGWKWRTAKYLNILANCTERIVVLSDATDVMFVEPPSELVRKFRKMKVPIVMGGERGLCTGKFKYDLSARKEMVNIYKKRDSFAYRFPNAGLIIGYTTPLLRLLSMNTEAVDDQAGFVSLHRDTPSLFKIDSETKLFANIVQDAPLFETNNEVDERNMWKVELKLDITIATQKAG